MNQKLWAVVVVFVLAIACGAYVIVSVLTHDPFEIHHATTIRPDTSAGPGQTYELTQHYRFNRRTGQLDVVVLRSGYEHLAKDTAWEQLGNGKYPDR